MQGRITVKGIRFHAWHGLTKLEREIGVRYRVDVAMITDIAVAATTDRIADAIDYREVHQIVVRTGRENSYHLIETLVANIARTLLERFVCESVDVSVEKETPVLDGVVDTVGVAVTVRREELS
ncbi:MAG: dihydroneopterin aldolase [Acidobacteriota bacterium]